MKTLNRSQLGLVIALLIIVALTIILASLEQLTSSQREEMTNCSVYNSLPSGYKAWQRVMEKAEIPLLIWKRPFDKLDLIKAPATMVMLSPFPDRMASLTGVSESVRPLLAWVAQGNTLVYIDSFTTPEAETLLKQLGVSLAQVDLTLSKAPSRLISSDGSLIVYSEVKQAFQSGKQKVLLRDAQQNPVLIQVPYHAGTVILGTVTDLASNRFLYDAPNNFQFFTHLVQQEGFPAYVNEFIHGYIEKPDIWSYYQQTPLGMIGLQCVLGLTFALWLSFFPWRPSQQMCETIVQGANPALFIQSIARIYQKANASALVLKPQLEQLEEIVRRRYLIDLTQPQRLQSLVNELRAKRAESPLSIEPIQAAQAVVEQNQKLSSQRLLTLSQQLSSIQDTLTYGRYLH